MVASEEEWTFDWVLTAPLWLVSKPTFPTNVSLSFIFPLISNNQPIRFIFFPERKGQCTLLLFILIHDLNHINLYRHKNRWSCQRWVLLFPFNKKNVLLKLWALKNWFLVPSRVVVKFKIIPKIFFDKLKWSFFLFKKIFINLFAQEHCILTILELISI